MRHPDRFQISRSAWATPLLILFTATASRSWIEVGPDCMRARYGWYQIEIPYTAVSDARETTWPWYAGIGWRTNFRSVIGLIGSYAGVVQIDLVPTQRTRLLGIPIGLKQLYLSLEDPTGFLQALEARS